MCIRDRAITKIHPIKSTLNLAIDYIVNGDKTDEQLFVSTHKCHESTAHTQFLRTRNDAGTKGTVLARHLIQSFLPGETSPELAHQIGMELCKKILKDEYEFVLSLSLIHISTSSKDALGFPTLIFSSKVPLNSLLSWKTKEIFFISSLFLISFIFLLPIVIVPELTLKNFPIKERMVLFPEPDKPTKATF